MWNSSSPWPLARSVSHKSPLGLRSSPGRSDSGSYSYSHFLLLSQVGSVQHVFHHVVIKIRQFFLRLAACLTSTLFETKVGGNDCKCSRDQHLNVSSETRSSLSDGRCGVVVGILAYYARGRGFHSRTVQTFVCMNMSVCIGSGCCYV
jgi:hypothetical protein